MKTVYFLFSPKTLYENTYEKVKKLNAMYYNELCELYTHCALTPPPYDFYLKALRYILQNSDVIEVQGCISYTKLISPPHTKPKIDIFPPKCV